jgi:hypothetical protein
MTESYNNSYRAKRVRWRTPVLVKLTCGHEVRCRIEPIHPTVKLGCTAGQRCGYFLHWVSWRNEETGATFENMWKPPADDDEGTGMIPEQRDGEQT